MNAAELAKPNNEADCTIKLEISGNRLVAMLNSLDQMLFETKRMTTHGDKWEFSSDWFEELHNAMEAARDELSRQRMDARGL